MSHREESVWLQDHAWPAVESYLAEHEHPTVLVPIGSTEQHGPHLPVGTDAYQAIDVAEGIAEAANTLVAPPLWYGDADHHMAFPGTVSLSSDTVVAMLTDVYESLLDHGFRNVITVNGHRIANLSAIDIAAKEVKADHPDAFLGTFDLLRFGVRVHNELRDGDPEDGMHGGEFETSFMLFQHGELVDESAFEPAVHEGWTRFASSDYVGIDDTVPSASSRHDWPEDAQGHHGDPTLAGEAKGERLYEAFVDNGVEFLNDLAERQAGDGGGQDLTY